MKLTLVTFAVLSTNSAAFVPSHQLAALRPLFSTRQTQDTATNTDASTTKEGVGFDEEKFLHDMEQQLPDLMPKTEEMATERGVPVSTTPDYASMIVAPDAMVVTKDMATDRGVKVSNTPDYASMIVSPDAMAVTEDLATDRGVKVSTTPDYASMIVSPDAMQTTEDLATGRGVPLSTTPDYASMIVSPDAMAVTEELASVRGVYVNEPDWAAMTVAPDAMDMTKELARARGVLVQEPNWAAMTVAPDPEYITNALARLHALAEDCATFQSQYSEEILELHAKNVWEPFNHRKPFWEVCDDQNRLTFPEQYATKTSPLPAVMGGMAMVAAAAAFVVTEPTMVNEFLANYDVNVDVAGMMASSQEAIASVTAQFQDVATAAPSVVAQEVMELL